MPIEFRNSVDVNKYANKLKASEADKNCTFKPTVNENSKMIAQNRQNNDNRSNNVFQRLIANKEETLFDCRSSEMSECNNPAINAISAEIDFNINADSQPRWKRLYDLHSEKQKYDEKKRTVEDYESRK